MSLRGAISGFGEVAARAHLRGWSAQPGIKLVAIHDPIAARRHHAINLIKGVRVYDDLELMLDAEALDFLDIASPPSFHADAARLALEAGVNAIVEKPLCLEPSDLAALTARAARNGRSLICVHNWKYSPAYRRSHELISSGRVGIPQHLSIVRMRPHPAGAGVGGERWRLKPRMGGGILIDHGWHAFYLACWLMGDEMPVSASCRLGLAETGVDDVADVNVEFRDGRTAAVQLSWRASARRTSAAIVGSKATLEIDAQRISLIDRSGKVEDHWIAETDDDSYHAAWFSAAAADYETVLNQGAQCEIARSNLREATLAMALMTAARKSSTEDGRPMRLDLP